MLRLILWIIAASFLPYDDPTLFGNAEMLDVDRKVRRATGENTTIDAHRYLDRHNFTPFQQAAIEKLNAGVTTVSEILRVLPRSAFDCYNREERLSDRRESFTREREREPVAAATDGPRVLPFSSTKF